MHTLKFAKMAFIEIFWCTPKYQTCVDINMQKGKTGLHHAAEEGSKECLKVLVHEFQADPEEVDIVRKRVGVTL